VFVKATCVFVTGVVGARIGIVALENSVALAYAVHAGIAGRTGIAVVARLLVGFVYAADDRVALVIGAWVAVVAVHRDSPGADSRFTRFPYRTGIAVAAIPPIVGRGKRALTRDRMARGGKTFRVLTLRFVALDERVCVNRALMRQRIGIAQERAVADVAILQWNAVDSLVAIAVYGEALALTLGAGVVYGARILVVTRRAVERIDATAGRIAAIHRADVPVVAVDRCSRAYPVLTMVRQRADIAIAALGTGQGRVRAPGIRVARILGTVVFVIAGDVVHLPVAVVVLPVALLRRGVWSIACSKARLRADTASFTHAELVLQRANRAQPQLYRFFGATADARIGHALLEHGTFRGGCIYARVAHGTGPGRAACSAEIAAVAVVYADILDACGSLAVRAVHTGAAQMRERGDARKLEVGSASRYLPAFPALRALLHATDGAYRVTHVVDANAGKAGKPRIARVHEAAFARSAFGKHLRLDRIKGILGRLQKIRGIRLKSVRRQSLPGKPGILYVRLASRVGLDDGAAVAAGKKKEQNRYEEQ